MPETTNTESLLADLNSQIAIVQSNIKAIKNRRMPFELRATKASWLVDRLKFKRWLRSPSKSYELWKMGLVLVSAVPLVIFGLCLLMANVNAPGFPVASVVLIVVGLSVAGLLIRLLYFPADSKLALQVVEAEIESRVALADLNRLKSADGLDDMQARLEWLCNERRKVLIQLRKEVASGVKKRTDLLQRNWKAMRDCEWENYLVEVFRALGASKANRIGGSGDQGVDLIVEIKGRRIAVQAKGYLHAVSNKAVQEAYSGMVHHSCCACVVITNSRFTSGARELAASTNCLLIGEDEFPDFVLGKFDMCREDRH